MLSHSREIREGTRDAIFPLQYSGSEARSPPELMFLSRGDMEKDLFRNAQSQTDGQKYRDRKTDRNTDSY